MDEWKRSGQIPAFGNWELAIANELPITQYFECAAQAGLLRYSSSSTASGHCHDDPPYMRGDRDLYAVDSCKHQRPQQQATRRIRERRCPRGIVDVDVKEKENGSNTNMNMNMDMRIKGKVCHVTEKPIRNSKQLHRDGTVPRPPKPVDEDLYKVPPELLQGTKRKKMLGFISKCLVPAACVS